MDNQTSKRIADEGLSAAALLGLFLCGNKVVETEEHLDELYDSLIELLEAARDESYRLRRTSDE